MAVGLWVVKILCVDPVGMRVVVFLRGVNCDPHVAGELATTVCSSVILSHTTLKCHTKLVTNGTV